MTNEDETGWLACLINIDNILVGHYSDILDSCRDLRDLGCLSGGDLLSSLLLRGDLGGSGRLFGSSLLALIFVVFRGHGSET